MILTFKARVTLGRAFIQQYEALYGITVCKNGMIFISPVPCTLS